MKRVVSISIGSSKRDHEAQVSQFGKTFRVRRIGTDGDLGKAVLLLKELDGKVDAIGIGGIAFHVTNGRRNFIFRDAKKLLSACKKTPVVDGSGLKHILERHVVRHVHEHVAELSHKRVLLVSALDRWGMASGFYDVGADVTLGDFMFGLGLNIPLKSMQAVARVGSLVLPFATQLPFHWLYPIGEQQEKRVARFHEYYDDADVIAGDFHYIHRHMPESLVNKIVVTNTVTPGDVAELTAKRASLLVTTTPNMGGRSFGTNMLEAMMVAASEKPISDIGAQDYANFIGDADLMPRVERLARRSFTR